MVLVAIDSPAADASGPVFTVMNTSEVPPDGVWFRNSPHTADTSRITGLGVYANERVQLGCYAFGDAVGPYNDSLWYFVLNVTRPTNDGAPNQGYLNAHYINDGQNANVVDVGVPACGSGPSTTQAVPPRPPTQTSSNDFVVMNTDETPPDGVWFRNSPYLADTDRIAGHGVFAGDRVALQCYAFGDSVGPYQDRLWYKVTNLTRPTVPSTGAANSGFLNAHYVNDGQNANVVDPGVPHCTGVSGPPPTPGGTTKANPTTPPPGRRLPAEPCAEAFGIGTSSTHRIFGGQETDHDFASSQYLVCSGAFGAPTGIQFSAQMQCAMVAAVFAFGAPLAAETVSNVCDGADLANSVLKGDWLGGAGSLALSRACGYVADAFSYAGGTAVAGVLSETGPIAVAVGVATAHALNSVLTLTCGALFDGGANAIGQQMESNHEVAVAHDIRSKGECLHERVVFGATFWSAAPC
jgi:hypothetical protein